MSAQVVSLVDILPSIAVIQRRANALDSLGDALRRLQELEDAVATVGTHTEQVAAFLTLRARLLIREYEETILAHGGRL